MFLSTEEQGRLYRYFSEAAERKGESIDLAVTEENLLSVSRYLGIEDEVQEILDDPVLRIQKQKVEQIIELVSHTDSMTPGEILEKVKAIVDYQ